MNNSIYYLQKLQNSLGSLRKLLPGLSDVKARIQVGDLLSALPEKALNDLIAYQKDIRGGGTDPSSRLKWEQQLRQGVTAYHNKYHDPDIDDHLEWDWTRQAEQDADSLYRSLQKLLKQPNKKILE